MSAALKGRKTSIKAALLDQCIVVGVGNIYACESLHRAGISPKRQGRHGGGRTRVELLVPAIKKVLKDAIAAGGSSLRDHVQVSGELGYFQHAWRVYGREDPSLQAPVQDHGDAETYRPRRPFDVLLPDVPEVTDPRNHADFNDISHCPRRHILPGV